MSPIKSGLVMLVALAVSGGGHPISAQQGYGGGGLGLYGVGPRLGENVTLALEFQDQLGLSQNQVASLQLLQAGILQDVAPLEAEIDGVRASILAGEVSFVDGLALLQGLRGEFQAASAPYRVEVDAVLTPPQHQTLQDIMWETRPLQAQTLGTPGTGLGRGAGFGLGWSGRMGLGRGAGLGVGRGTGRGQGRGLRWRD